MRGGACRIESEAFYRLGIKRLQLEPCLQPAVTHSVSAYARESQRVPNAIVSELYARIAAVTLNDIFKQRESGH